MRTKSIAKKLYNDFYFKHTTLFYFTFFFAFIVIYNHLFIAPISEWRVDASTYSHHLVDYSMGFCTKLLPGAIYHLFFKEVYENQLNLYLIILMLIFFAVLSLSVASVVAAQKTKNERSAMTILAMFFLSGPSTFAIHTEQFGMLDTYWLYFGAVFFLIIRNKYLKYLIPLVFIASLLIHFSSALCALIAFALVLLYESCFAEKKGERIGYVIIFVLSAGVTAFLFSYFLIYEKSNLVYSMEEFDKIMAQRDKAGYNYTVYFDATLYDTYPPNEYVWISPEQVFPFLDGKLSAEASQLYGKVISQLAFNLRFYTINPSLIFTLIIFILICSPLMVVFTAFWRHMIRESKGSKKLVYVLMLLQYYYTLIGGALSAADVVRWAGHAFLVQFTLVLYVAVREKQLKWMYEKIFVSRYWQVAIYFSTYIFIHSHAYS